MPISNKKISLKLFQNCINYFWTQSEFGVTWKTKSVLFSPSLTQK